MGHLFKDWYLSFIIIIVIVSAHFHLIHHFTNEYYIIYCLYIMFTLYIHPDPDPVFSKKILLNSICVCVLFSCLFILLFWLILLCLSRMRHFTTKHLLLIISMILFFELSFLFNFSFFSHVSQLIWNNSRKRSEAISKLIDTYLLLNTFAFFFPQFFILV